MARFVLVDDSKIARNFLKNILIKAGHDVVAEGANGLEGFDLYREHKPDVITLDVVMPMVTGMECLKQIMDLSPEAKVVMVTSVGKDNLAEEAKQLGAKAVIVKPIKEEDVLSVVNPLL